MTATACGSADVREMVAPHTALAFTAMKALRSDRADERAFARRVGELQRPEGYRLVGVFEHAAPVARAVAGFRTGHDPAWGHHHFARLLGD